MSQDLTNLEALSATHSFETQADHILAYLIACLKKESSTAIYLPEKSAKVHFLPEHAQELQDFFYGNSASLELPANPALSEFYESWKNQHHKDSLFLAPAYQPMGKGNVPGLVPAYFTEVRLELQDQSLKLMKLDYSPTFNQSLLPQGLSLNEAFSLLEELEELSDWLVKVEEFEAQLEQETLNSLVRRPLLFLSGDAKSFLMGLIHELDWIRRKELKKIPQTALRFLLQAPGDESRQPLPEPLISVFKMDDIQTQVVVSALQSPFTVITGPPGTGKSQVVLNLLTNLSLQGKTVLFASKNNQAVGTVLDKLQEIQTGYCTFVRVGNKEEKKKGLKLILDSLRQEMAVSDTLVPNEAFGSLRQNQQQIQAGYENLTTFVSLYVSLMNDFAHASQPLPETVKDRLIGILQELEPLDEWQNRLIELIRELETEQAHLSRTQSELRTCAQSIEQTGTELNQLNQKLAQRQAQRAVMQDQLNLTQSQIALQTQVAEQLQSLRHEANQVLLVAEAELQKQLSEYREAETKRHELLQDLAHLESSLQSVQNLRRELAEMEQAQAEQQALQESAQTQQASCQQIFETALAQFTEASQTLSQEEQSQEQARAKRSDLASRLHSLTQSQEQIKSELEALGQHARQLKSHIAELEIERTGLINTHQRLEKEAHYKQSQYDHTFSQQPKCLSAAWLLRDGLDWRYLIDRTLQQLQDAQSRQQAAKTQAKLLTQQLDEVSATAGQLEQTLQAQRQDLDEFAAKNLPQSWESALLAHSLNTIELQRNTDPRFLEIKLKVQQELQQLSEKSWFRWFRTWLSQRALSRLVQELSSLLREAGQSFALDLLTLTLKEGTLKELGVFMNGLDDLQEYGFKQAALQQALQERSRLEDQSTFIRDELARLEAGLGNSFVGPMLAPWPIQVQEWLSSIPALTPQDTLLNHQHQFEQLKQSWSELEQASHALQTSQSTVQSSRADLEQLEAKLTALQHELEAQIQSDQDQDITLRAERQQLGPKLTSLRQELDELDLELSAGESRLQLTQQRVSMLEESKRNAESALFTSQADAHAIESALFSLLTKRELKESGLTPLLSQVPAWQEQCTDCQSDLTALEASLQALSLTVSVAQAATQTHQQKAASLDAEWSASEANLSASRAQLEASDAQIRELETDLFWLRNRITEVISQRDAAKAKHVALKQEIAAIETHRAPELLSQSAQFVLDLPPELVPPSGPHVSSYQAGVQLLKQIRNKLNALESLADIHQKMQALSAEIKTLKPASQLIKQLKASQTELENLSRERFNQQLGKRMTPELETLSQLVKDYFERWQDQALKPLFQKLSSLMPIWATTNLSTRYNLPNAPALFDYVIIDEASQNDIASIIPLLFRARNAIVIGDPQQLRHIAGIRPKEAERLAAEHEVGEAILDYHYVHHSAYDLAARRYTERTGKTPWLLSNHYRCHPDIVAFSNHSFYQSKLFAATYKRPEAWLAEPGIFWHPVTGRYHDKSNEPEARAVVKCIQSLLAAKGSERVKIGVITPFRNQEQLILHFLRKAGIKQGKEEHNQVLCSTVHRFQGDEKDIIIYSPVMSAGIQPPTQQWLDGGRELLNVAVTRARSTLIIMGDEEYCQGTRDLHKQLLTYCREIASKHQQPRFNSELARRLYEALKAREVDFDYQTTVGPHRLDFVLKTPDGYLALELGPDQQQEPLTDAARQHFFLERRYQTLYLTHESLRHNLETFVTTLAAACKTSIDN